MKSKLYENQQIGNFNVLLGYTLGEAGYKRPFSINTFQQTFKHDKVIGDLFANLGGSYFILEFKKAFEDCRMERIKPQCDKLLSALRKNDTANELSRKGHFICYGDVTKSNEGFDQLDYNLIPYCELNEILTCKKIIKLNIKEFTHSLIGKNKERIPFSVGMNSEEISLYVDLLKECSGEDNYSASGIIACFHKEKGLISVPFDNMVELELLMEKSSTITKNKSIDRSIIQSKSMDRGFSM